MFCHDRHFLCNNPELGHEAKTSAERYWEEMVEAEEVVESYMVDYPHKPNFIGLKESA